jgi:hypothetical protein
MEDHQEDWMSVGPHIRFDSSTAGCGAGVMWEDGANRVTLVARWSPLNQESGLIGQYGIKMPFKMKAIEVAGASPWNRDGGSMHGWTSTLPGIFLG